jgi:hypothetical protein
MATGSSYSISGLHAILNPDVIKPGVNLKELEHSMINGGYISKPLEPEPQDKLDAELSSYAAQIGIDGFGNKPKDTKETKPDPVVKKTVRPPLTKPNTTEDDEDDPFYTHKENTETDNDDDIDDVDEDTEEVEDPVLNQRTQEQRRKAQIDAVLGYENNDIDFESEKQEDTKCNMLAQIDDLRTALLEDAVDISRIPEVSTKSSFSEVENTLRILQYKLDHNRYCFLAEELFLFAAAGLEEVFDGKKQYLGKKPNLKGYSSHVNVKLRRMRNETGRLVNGFMKDNNISPAWRFLIEFIPSMVLYSREKQREEEEDIDDE